MTVSDFFFWFCEIFRRRVCYLCLSRKWVDWFGDEFLGFGKFEFLEDLLIVVLAMICLCR